MRHATHRLGTLLLLSVIVAAAIAVPLASGQAQDQHQGAERPVVVEVNNDGFDWGDAALGAAGAIAVALLVVGVALAVRTNQSKHHHQGGRS